MDPDTKQSGTQSGQLVSGEDCCAGSLLEFSFDGKTLTAYAGQTVAAALLAAGHRCLRLTSRRGEPRGLFCGMGVCHECLVQINGRPNVQACRTPVAAGMHVETQLGAGCWEPLP